QEEVLETGALAILAQSRLFAKQLGYDADDFQSLLQWHEAIETNAQMGIGRKSAAHAQGETQFRSIGSIALNCRQRNVIDLRIGAPATASSGCDLELARQIVEVRIGGKFVCDALRNGRSVDNLVLCDSRQGASGYIA